MRYLFFLMLLLLCTGAKSQDIKNEGMTYDYYCVYYGQAQISGKIKPVKLIWGDRKDEVKLTNSEGEIIEFNNMVDVSNYLSKRGWKVIDTGAHGSYWYVVYVKSVRNDKEAKEGLFFNKDFK